MSRRTEHASRYLRGNQAIGPLLAGIERNARLLLEVRRILPPSVASHCLHAAIEQETLVLVTDSPAWGSRLRFFAPELLAALRSRHRAVEGCRVRIRPVSLPPAKGPSFPGARLSAAAVEHLLAAAGSAGDEDIAAALRRLAKAGGDPGQAEAAKGRR